MGILRREAGHIRSSGGAYHRIRRALEPAFGNRTRALTEGSHLFEFPIRVAAMRGSLRVLAAALTVAAVANAQSANPACQRLEVQLATLDRGNGDPARADQIR